MKGSGGDTPAYVAYARGQVGFIRYIDEAAYNSREASDARSYLAAAETALREGEWGKANENARRAISCAEDAGAE